MTEKELLDRFSELLIKKNKITQEQIRISENNKSKQMDVVIMDDVTNTVICLEAKVFNNTNSNSNNFLSIFGKILKGRILKKDIPFKNYNFVEYGILILKENEDLFKKYLTIIDIDDWNTFCEKFNLKYIYVCDENEYVIKNTFDYRKNNDKKIEEYYDSVNKKIIIEKNDND